ncbi:hypothetical protein ES703_109618 [subsurface metagenome]
MVFLPLGLALSVGASPQYNIDAPPRHIGGYGYRPQLPCPSNNFRLFRMLFGIEYVVWYPPLLQEVAQVLRLLNRHGTNQHRPFLLIKLLNLSGYSLKLGLLILINAVGEVLTNHGLMSGDFHHIKFIYLVKLFSLGNRSAGHSRQLVIHAEVVLDGNGGKGSALPLNPDMLLGFYRLMQALGIAAANHQPPGKLIHNDNLTILYYIFAVPSEQDMSLKGALQIASEGII